MGLLASTSLLSATTVETRVDLQEGFQKHFCGSAKFPTSQELWSLAVFDAHLELRTVTPKKGFQVNSDKLKEAALSLASQRGHRGVVFGLCPSGKAWAVSTPSPRQIIARSANEVQVDLYPLQDACGSLSIDFAPSSTALTKRLMSIDLSKKTPSPLSFNTKYLDTGTISISCKPHSKDLGPIPWAIVPTHGFELPIPKAENWKDLNALASWINRLRAAEGLKRLEFSTDPSTTVNQVGASLLKNNTSLNHLRPQLSQAKSQLELQNLDFLGENRGLAKDYQGIAWLFWNSARHRKLLFHPKARLISLQEHKMSDSILVLALLVSKPDQLSAR